MNKQKIALAIVGICMAVSAFTLPASARGNSAWKAANQWAVQTWMMQHGGYGYGYNPYNNYNSYNYGYNPYYNQYYNQYYSPYNNYNYGYNPYSWY